MSKALQNLRVATSNIHQKLHELAIFDDLNSGRFNRDDYINLLRGLYNFYASADWEILSASNKHPQSNNTYSYIPRADKLKRDLTLLGENAPYHVRKHPILKLKLDCPGQLAGILYVIEGSVLGGATIYGVLKQYPLQQRQLCQSYWAWCRRHGADRWRAARAYIEFLLTSSTSSDAHIYAAQSTFLAMQKSLQAAGLR